jgi:hypothetical protein
MVIPADDAPTTASAAAALPAPRDGGESLRLYEELASWWHVFSPPSHYVEEAADLLPELLAAADAPPRTLLELGAGAGSPAWHLKGDLELTLTDRSQRMLEVSRGVNPECRHVRGDMRTLDLGETFDLVLVHDAIMYATDRRSLAAVMATAHRHLRPGGGAVFVPDCVEETFAPATTVPTDGPCATCIGPGTPSRTTSVSTSPGPSCCGRPTARRGSRATATASGCSPARPGSPASARPASPHDRGWIPGGGTSSSPGERGDAWG